MISANLSAIFYLVSGLFILALRGLSSPETSRQGNFFEFWEWLLLLQHFFLQVIFQLIYYCISFILLGGSIGAFIAYRIPMTAMPELAADFIV